MRRIAVVAMVAVVAVVACRGDAKSPGAAHAPPPDPTAEAKAIARLAQLEAGYTKFEESVRLLLRLNPYCAKPGTRDDAYDTRIDEALRRARETAGLIDATVEVRCGKAIAAQYSVAHATMMVNGTVAHDVHGRHLWDPLESTCRHASLSIL